MAVSDARRLKPYEQARAHWGEETAEVLMEVIVPAGQDMATKADLDAAVATLSARIDGVDSRMEGLATKESVLRLLLMTQIPIHLGILGLFAGVVGLSFTG
jgi:hypothetical protein